MKSRSKWVAGVATCLTAIAFVTAANSARTVKQSASRLTHLESELHASDEFTDQSLNEWMEGHYGLLTKLARNLQPNPEWVASQQEGRRRLARFVGQPRHLELSPNRVAEACHQLGQLMVLDGDALSAITALETSIGLAEREGNQKTAALATNTLGCIHASQGRWDLARQYFQHSSAALEGELTQLPVRAIALRNLGLMERSLTGDGTATVRQAITVLKSDPGSGKFGLTSELLIDTEMLLCEMHWTRREFSQASEACQRAHQHLVDWLGEIRKANWDPTLAAPNRYTNAILRVSRNLQAIEAAPDGALPAVPATRSGSFGAVATTADAWQWLPLANLTTELVSPDLQLTAAMSPEFEQQRGIAVGWGMFDGTHTTLTRLIQLLADRLQIVVLVDNDESLEEAQLALTAAGVSLDSIRFGIFQSETPWFRDTGPIVGKSPSGDWIWFDPFLARKGRRLVGDALPQVLARFWTARVARTPLQVEGGALLTNGNGITVCSTKVIFDNREAGFDDEFILRELRRMTGASTVLPLQPLNGEGTGHVDMFLTFPGPDTVVVGQYRDANDPNRMLLDEHAAMLSQAGLKVVRLPMPERSGSTFRTYTNVVYANGMLLVPSYSMEVESEVRSIYQSLLPEWQIELVDCTSLVTKGGALHCLVSNLGQTPYDPLPRTAAAKTSPPAVPLRHE